MNRKKQTVNELFKPSTIEKWRERDLQELAQLKFQAEMLSFAISRSRDIRTEKGLLAHVEAGDLMDEVVRKMEALLESERAYKGETEDELDDEEA